MIPLPIIVGLALITSTTVFATPVPDITEYLETEISTIDQAIGSSEEIEGPIEALSKLDNQTAMGNSNSNLVLYLANFWFRLRPRVGFTLPAIVKVEINLETEVLWQRVIPENWEPYNPKP
ncbi:MAG: hypothetical protein ABIQ95_00460 [Bdellovibrionia bacterium]